jgi:hypothetical protein
LFKENRLCVLLSSMHEFLVRSWGRVGRAFWCC